MPNPKQTDPPDVAVATIAEAYKQLGLGRADEQFAFVGERVFKSEQDAARHPSDQQMRSAVPDRPSSRRSRALLGLGLLWAACVSVAAFAWQSSYGDAAKLTRWAPPLVSTSSPSLEKQQVPARPTPPTVDVATAKAALPQPAPLAQITPQDVAPTAAPMSPELAQSTQTMTRDLANLQQGIEQLKTNQDQMVRDYAAVAEQLKAAQVQMARDNAAVAELKASQEQMARDNAAVAAQLNASEEQMARLIAKASEQNLRPRTPIAAPKRKPAPTLQSPQARAQPQVTLHSQPKQQQSSSVPRAP
jgi:hypothetical protein